MKNCNDKNSTQTTIVGEPYEYWGITTDGNNGVWFISDGNARWIGGPHPYLADWTQFEISKGEKLETAFNSNPLFKDKAYSLHKMQLKPHQYYPRISRPNYNNVDEFPIESPNYEHFSYSIKNSLYQIRTLVDLLDQIIKSVHPDKKNLETFGTNIRNLIILTSTECESQFKSILKSNNYEPKSNIFSTNDYVKINLPLHLHEYSVQLRQFPTLGSFYPFKKWNAAQATFSLDWYQTYNDIKHDREHAFEQATLRTALNAICGLWILIAAQHGTRGIREFSDLDRYFELESVPKWPYSEVYIFPNTPFGEDPQPFVPIDFPF